MYKNKTSKNKIILLATLTLAICLAVGGTLAYIFDISDVLNNVFSAPKMSTTVDEDIEDPTVKKDVKVTNTGDIDSWIRASIVVNWKASDGSVYGTVEPVRGTAGNPGDYTMSTLEVATPSQEDLERGCWFLGSDGYYYWSKPVAPNASTGILIDTAEPTGTAPDGYYLSIEILGSSIQSRPDYAVKDAWSAVKVDDGTLVLS